MQITVDHKNTKYVLSSRFKTSPLYVGEIPGGVITLLGDVEWTKLFNNLLTIIEVYKVAPNLSNNFISNIPFDIHIEGYTSVELYQSYKEYLEIMNTGEVKSLVSKFIKDCDKNRFIPTINGVDFKSIISN